MDEKERQKRREARLRQRRRQVLLGKIMIGGALLLTVSIGTVLIKDVALKGGMNARRQSQTETESQAETAPEEERLLLQAEKLAAGYDYDGAIETLKGSGAYAGSTAMQEAAAGYGSSRDACVEYQPEDVTHVFFHTLIVDPKKAFDGDSKEAGYNQVMTTVSEFNKMMQSMYEKGYVIVSLHDMCEVHEDGTVTKKTIRLPAGKKPFVISQDDVSYYHYMDGDGFASRLVLDENGDVKCEYKNDDGSVSVGDYDMIPILDTFIDQHPDFSYKGHKGVIALTGYNGILGYRTDISYKTGENLQDNQAQWLAKNPDFDYDRECEEAKAVADAMKADGWEFASHTWGHINVTEKSVEGLQTDTQKWLDYVKPLIGETDIIIFAFGSEIGSWQGYTADNQKFTYLKSVGFNIFCNVDSAQHWVQFGENYMRQGRRNLDGYRMYYNPELLTDLFEVSDVWDNTRPTPVPPIG